MGLLDDNFHLLCWQGWQVHAKLFTRYTFQQKLGMKSCEKKLASPQYPICTFRSSMFAHPMFDLPSKLAKNLKIPIKYFTRKVFHNTENFSFILTNCKLIQHLCFPIVSYKKLIVSSTKKLFLQYMHYRAQ